MCEGAQPDVYPSRMCLDMAGGRQAYLMECGKYPDSNSLVDIFDPSTREDVGTVSEQHEFYKEWIKNFKL